TTLFRPVSTSAYRKSPWDFKGDHAKIAEWRRREAERNTRERRPDLSIPSGVGERTRIRLTHPARSDASEDKGRSVIASRHRASRDARLFRRALAAWRSRRTWGVRRSPGSPRALTRGSR